MARIRANDDGLLWDRTVRGIRAASAVKEKPNSDWRPPEELPRLRGAKRIAIDTENYDPDLRRLGPGVRRGAFIAGFSVGRDDGSRWYFPVRHEGGDNMDSDRVFAWARDEFNNFDGEVVGTQLIYDLDMLAQEGITFANAKRFLDIQNAEPLIDENRFNYGLDALSQDYLEVGKDEDLLRQASLAYGFGSSQADVKGNLWRLPARYVGPYGEADVDRPLRILPLQEKKLAEEGLTDLFYDVESKLIPMLLAMRRHGVRVDLDRAEQVRAILAKERDKWLAIMRSFTGPRGELMAADSLAPALRERGLTLYVTAAKHRPQINKEFFERYRGDPLVDAIAAGRRCDKLLNTFIDSYVLKHNVNGRIHTCFNQLLGEDEAGRRRGTIARLSSSDPDLQNLPSRENDADEWMSFGEDVVKLVRGIFVPEPDEDWERHDLSQIEFRYLTNYAVGRGAEEARAAYNDDPKTNFHKMCARMARIDPNDESKHRKVKNVNFSKVYGGGIRRIAKLMNCSFEEAFDFVALYDRELPFVKATLRKAAEWAQRRGFVTTILNRRGRFPLWEPADYDTKGVALPRAKALAAYGSYIKRAGTHAALSRKLQGSAADHIKKGMVDIWEAGICNVLGPLLLTVHDENDWSKPRTAAAAEAAREARHLLENAIKISVPVTAEVKIGANWGVTS
jgi:DNA polymerase I-like protein with 3'-5' exonuclease and polymerase domains